MNRFFPLFSVTIMGVSRALAHRHVPISSSQQHRLFSIRSGDASAKEAASTSVEKITKHMKYEAEKEMERVVELFGGGSKKEDTSPLLWTTREEANAFIDEKLDAILFDCDGVLYRSPDEAPGASACIQSLLDRGKKIFFVTNNAGSNRMQLREKLTSILKIDGLTEEMMVSSSYSAAQYLKHQILEKKGRGRLYVIGSQGLCEELRQTGFEVSGGPSQDKPSMTRDELAEYEFDEHPVDAVVVGHDIDFNFRKLSIANVLLQMNPDAALVATNKDSFDLVGVDGRHIPGNGSLVAALEYASRRQAINVGKPSKTLVDLIASEHGLDPARSMIVGDRLDTDIRFGAESGMYSALVMTGVTSTKHLKDVKEGRIDDPLPSVILPYVGLMS